MSKEAHINIRTTPPKPTSINKVLLIIVAAIILFIFVFAFVNAFTEKTPNQSQTETDTITHTQNGQVVVSDAVTKLPSDYTKTAAIQKYIHTEPPIQHTQAIPPQVQAELNALRSQQSSLESEIATLSQKHTNNNAQQSMKTQQAATSGLFFPGSSPKINTMKPSTAQTNLENHAGNIGSSSASKLTSYEQQNMQSQKLQFLKSSEPSEGIYDPHQLVQPLSPYEVQAGTVIPTTLITALNSSLPGEVVAQVEQNIYDSVSGKYLLIPKGSKILGAYDSKVAYGQTRMLLAFKRIIRPDGSSIQLGKFPGIDALGAAGVQGRVDNHWGKIIGAATISTLLSFGAGATSDNISNGNVYYRSAKQSAMLGAAQNVASVGQDITNRAIDVQPTIQLPPGYQFNVIVKKDMILKPYSTSNGDE